ncbi:hypothetical protein J14TS5_62420 [Paenibacillus lautus]|nr:hypothetical protein J14TS5_62420 [Paenibacillus lautus]
MVNIGYDVYSPPYFIMEFKEGLSLFKGVTHETGHLVMSPELEKVIQAKE